MYEDLEDVMTYRTVDSPLGRLLLVGTPVGLMKVSFESEDHDLVLETLGAALGRPLRRHLEALEEAARQVDEYFTGRRKRFELPLDHRLSKGFRLTVLEQMAQIPYGTTTTYTLLAEAAGSPRAVRAVGTACATNPLPLVLPCHRVLRSDGTTGQYAGGTPSKIALLDLEAGRQAP